MANIDSLISQRSDRHVLLVAPARYVAGFVAAASRVYPADRIEEILQQKFSIPDDSKFNLDTYLQGAAELSVQNQLRQEPRVKNVSIEKQVNPPKNVDAYCEAGHTRISIEVKCAVEKSVSPDALIIRTLGRLPGHRETFDDLKSRIETVDPAKSVQVGKNKDNTLKDFLVSAHEKFSPSSGAEDLNILFIACGYHFNMQE